MLTDTIQVYYPGTDVERLQRDATRFIGSLERKPWWVEWRCVVNGEGGRSALVDNAMLSALNVGAPWYKGFYEYSRRLVKLYGKSNVENLTASLDELLEFLAEEDIIPSRMVEYPSEELTFGEVPLGVPSAGAYTSNSLSVDSVIHNPEEEYFMICYANTGSMTEACSLLGISRQDGDRIYNRIKQRAGRVVLSTPTLL